MGQIHLSLRKCTGRRSGIPSRTRLTCALGRRRKIASGRIIRRAKDGQLLTHVRGFGRSRSGCDHRYNRCLFARAGFHRHLRTGGPLLRPHDPTCCPSGRTNQSQSFGRPRKVRGRCCQSGRFDRARTICFAANGLLCFGLEALIRRISGVRMARPLVDSHMSRHRYLLSPVRYLTPSIGIVLRSGCKHQG